MLATSRELLGLAGETAWRVPSLGLPDPDAAPDPARLAQAEAVRLFAERARASLGETAYAAAWAAGQALTLEQAVAYALEDAPAAA